MAHPRRRDQAEALLARLHGADRALVLDPEPEGPPGPLRTAAAAWAGPYGEARHRLVLQDDVVPAENFLDLVAEAVRSRPDDPIAFYSNWNHWNGSAVRLAALSGAGWAQAIPDEYAPSLAVVLPAPWPPTSPTTHSGCSRTARPGRRGPERVPAGTWPGTLHRRPQPGGAPGR